MSTQQRPSDMLPETHEEPSRSKDSDSNSSDSVESSCSDSSEHEKSAKKFKEDHPTPPSQVSYSLEQRHSLARQWSENNPEAASSSAANAMFFEYLRVVQAKHDGTYVSYEDAKQDESSPDCSHQLTHLTAAGNLADSPPSPPASPPSAFDATASLSYYSSLPSPATSTVPQHISPSYSPLSSDDPDHDIGYTTLTPLPPPPLSLQHTSPSYSPLSSDDSGHDIGYTTLMPAQPPPLVLPPSLMATRGKRRDSHLVSTLDISQAFRKLGPITPPLDTPTTADTTCAKCRRAMPQRAIRTLDPTTLRGQSSAAHNVCTRSNDPAAPGGDAYVHAAMPDAPACSEYGGYYSPSEETKYSPRSPDADDTVREGPVPPHFVCICRRCTRDTRRRGIATPRCWRCEISIRMECGMAEPGDIVWCTGCGSSRRVSWPALVTAAPPPGPPPLPPLATIHQGPLPVGKYFLSPDGAEIWFQPDRHETLTDHGRPRLRTPPPPSPTTPVGTHAKWLSPTHARQLSTLLGCHLAGSSLHPWSP